MPAPDDGFALPDWQAPFDADALIARAPEAGVVKGLFFQDILDAAVSLRVTLPAPRQRYLPFIDYPMREYMGLLVSATRVIHPREPLRNGLRRLGRMAYPTLSATLLGRAIFGVAGRDYGTIVSLASRAYAVTIKPGVVTLAERAPTRAVVTLRDLWTFPDTYHVGVFEGALIAVGLRGEVKVRVLSPCDVDFEVTWQP
jgi:uncharacterized protein (TIGR02265 family)